MQQEQQQRSAQNYTIYAIYEQAPSPSGVQWWAHGDIHNVLVVKILKKYIYKNGSYESK